MSERENFDLRRLDDEAIAALKNWGYNLDGSNSSEAVIEVTFRSTKKVSESKDGKGNPSPKGRIDLGRKDVRLGKSWY